MLDLKKKNPLNQLKSVRISPVFQEQRSPHKTSSSGANFNPISSSISQQPGTGCCSHLRPTAATSTLWDHDYCGRHDVRVVRNVPPPPHTPVLYQAHSLQCKKHHSSLTCRLTGCSTHHCCGKTSLSVGELFSIECLLWFVSWLLCTQRQSIESHRPSPPVSACLHHHQQKSAHHVCG